MLQFKRCLRTDAPMIQRIQLPGKTSCTVNMGMIVNPSTDLVVAAGILGNGFSGRLMKYVRDQKGLTYGIGSKMKRENGAGILKIVATHPKIKMSSVYNLICIRLSVSSRSRIVNSNLD